MKSVHLKEINSTNDYVKKHISELENLTFVYADRQTSGRGRLTRKWIDSGEDNLFLTIVIKPTDDITDINLYPNFTQYLSVVLALVLEENYNLKPQIKWPNDVLINGKKVAGILAEGTFDGAKFRGMALGIGVNLNTEFKNLSKIDKPATSIFQETGLIVDKQEFLKQLYTKFCLLYDSFVCDGFKSVKEIYISKANFINRQLKINVFDNIHEGVAIGLTDDGALRLKEDEEINTYCIGDIL